MLLTITTTYSPASDLGFLLEKHPARTHEFELSAGRAHVFYSEATESRCTVSLLLDVDPIGLVRGRPGQKIENTVDQYVNDRPYVASSLLSVALGIAFKSALAGRSRNRPELAVTPLPLEAHIATVPSRGGESFLRALFEPLGYQVETREIPLDTHFEDWGRSPYFSVTLSATCTLQSLLQHLYVLIPVLDDDKHYWVGEAEVEKLLRHAGGWLANHPQKEKISLRYLKHRRSLARAALARLTAEDEEDIENVESAAPEGVVREQRLEEKTSLNEKRIAAVAAVLQDLGSKTVVDLGCGEGKVLASLFKLKQLERLVGMDVSLRALEHAHDRLNLDRLPPRQRERIDLLHGSLIYRDDRIKGFEAATLIEVIEHLDADRLSALERVLFEFARPNAIVITTPNSEYNVRFETLKPGQMRHGNHRFEWTRAEFQAEA